MTDPRKVRPEDLDLNLVNPTVEFVLHTDAAPPTGDPQRCPTCQSDAPASRRWWVNTRSLCTDPWHAAPPTGDREPDPYRYEPFDQAEKLGEPPWSGPALEAWERAHGHDARLKCYPEFGCFAIEDGLERRIAALVADKAASDDVIEALAARIAELERERDDARRDLETAEAVEEHERGEMLRDAWGTVGAALAAERVRGDRLAEALRDIINTYSADAMTEIAVEALAADPEGGSDMTETPQQQIDRLAAFIMEEVPGEPSQSEGAVDTAIRLIRAYQARLKKIRKLPPLYVRPSGGKDYHKCFFLAADPEGGPTDAP